MVDDIIELCIKKQWCEAHELCEKYINNCFHGKSTIRYSIIRLTNAAFVER